jgi:5-methylcytosine-specific restriction enzyme subunit McrC
MSTGRTQSEPLTLSEYGTLSYENLDESGVRRLEKMVTDLGVPVFKFYRFHAQAQQYVGTLAAGNREVQILPKIYDSDNENLGYLVLLLSFTKRLRLRQTGISDHERLEGSFLEIWIRHFAMELNYLLRRRPMHRYVEVEERVGFLRGKLLVERELAGTGLLYARYACRYEVFTPDHLLNRALRFCNALLLRQTRSLSNRVLLQENDALLSDVSSSVVRVEDLDRIHLDRLNRHYEPILGLCRLLLENSTLDLKAGRINQLAFVFDMNKLFEEFVAEFLKRHRSKIDLGGGRHLARVGYQHRLGRLFGAFGMDVDLALTDDAGETFLVDTKYKVLDANERHGGLSQADFYQMYAYGSAGIRDYDDIVLLYPTTTSPVEHVFHQGSLRLHVRQFDPRIIYNRQSSSLDALAAARELSRALTIARGGESPAGTQVANM